MAGAGSLDSFKFEQGCTLFDLVPGAEVNTDYGTVA